MWAPCDITGFHDSALCCIGAEKKNSLHTHSLLWEATCRFSCGTLPQLNRPRHLVAFVFALVAVFVQPTVCDKICWNTTRLYRSEALIYSSLSPNNVVLMRVSVPICQNNIVGGQGIVKCSNNFVQDCR